MLLPSTFHPTSASAKWAGAPDMRRGSSIDGKWYMERDREPEQPENDRDRGPTRGEILIAILTAVTALAGCVEHLAQ
jgi:hypothetical protein